MPFEEKIVLLATIVGKDAPTDAIKIAIERWPNWATDPDHGRAVSVFVQGYKHALKQQPKKKTMKQWRVSALQLHAFLQPGDEISEGVHNYIGGATSPQYCSREFTQMGEATREENGVLFYMTSQAVGDKYLYLGVLPEFKQ